MSFVICCPCGNPLECESLDLVVSLACPSCGRSLTLEFDDGQTHRCRALLTVMEGPFWVGERFLVPVGEDLLVGRSLGNWLSLDAEDVLDQHCRIRLTTQGSFVVRDAGGDGAREAGGDGVRDAGGAGFPPVQAGAKDHAAEQAPHPTSGIRHPTSDIRHSTFDIPHPTSDIRHPEGGVFVDDQQVTRAKLDSGQSFRIGPFRLRLDYFASDNIPVAVGRLKAVATIGRLPTMTRVTRIQTPAYWISQHRFTIARWMMIVFAVMTGVFHYCHLRAEQGWAGSSAFVLSVSLLVLFTELGRRVSLARPRVSWTLLGGMAALTLLDAIWIPSAGVWISTLSLGVGLAMLTALRPSEVVTWIAAAFSAGGGLAMTIVTIQAIVYAVGEYLGN